MTAECIHSAERTVSAGVAGVDTMEGPVAHDGMGYAERIVDRVPLHTEPQTGGLVQ